MIPKNICRAVCLAWCVTVVTLEVSCRKTNEAAAPVVTISGVSKTLLNIGDTLEIMGTNFSPVPDLNLVSVASISYVVIKSSPTELWVVVPKEAQTGKLSIAYKGGQATQFGQQLTVVGAAEPVVTSISPTSAYEGDTIVVTGKNFATPYDRDAITFNGINGIYPGLIINATPTELRVVVPNFAASGPVQVTSNGVSSQLFQYSISRLNPAEDGALYWMNVGDPYANPGSTFFKGLANDVLPQSSLLFSVPPIFQKNYDYSAPYIADLQDNNAAPIYNYVVNDQQHNAYYLVNDNASFPVNVSLMKLSGDFTTPTKVWSVSLSTPVYTNFYNVPLDTIDYPPSPYPYLPLEQVSMDGDKAYIKMGLSDDYYVGDLSQSTPAFTLQKNVFGDTTAFDQQFGKDYIFYPAVGYPYDIFGNGTTFYYDPTDLNGFYYMRRGSPGVRTKIPVPFNNVYPGMDRLVCMLADPSHGNVVLIVIATLNSGNYWKNVIYKFDADTKELTDLYDEKNWPDALSNITQYDNSRVPNSGFLWLGTHIYYTNTSALQYTTMRRLNDNGVNQKLYTVYSRMEPLNAAQSSNFRLFIGK